MRILLEIKEDKAAFIMKLLAHFKFVKAQTLDDSKKGLLDGLKEAVAEVQHK